MILNILSIVLFLIFLTLSMIHFYWVFGGEWGLKNAIPTTKENENIDFKPSALATALVAFFLLAFGVFYLLQTTFFSLNLPNWFNFLLWFLPSIFLIRAIGDFNYVGFFKRKKNTLFAKWDRKLFSPLCLFISFIGFLILLIQ